MLASFSIIDGIIATLTHSMLLALNVSQFTIFGIKDDSSEHLTKMNVDGDLAVISAFLKTERAAIEEYEPATACAKCIQHAARNVQVSLEKIHAKIEVHEHMLLRYWYRALCDNELDILWQDMSRLKSDFAMLVRIMHLQGACSTCRF